MWLIVSASKTGCIYFEPQNIFRYSGKWFSVEFPDFIDKFKLFRYVGVIGSYIIRNALENGEWRCIKIIHKISHPISNILKPHSISYASLIAIYNFINDFFLIIIFPQQLSQHGIYDTNYVWHDQFVTDKLSVCKFEVLETIPTQVIHIVDKEF